MTGRVRLLLGGALVALAATLYLAIVSSTGTTHPLTGSRIPATVERAAIARTAVRWGASPFAVGGPASSAVDKPPGTPATQTGLLLGRNGRAVDMGGLSPQQYITQWSALARTGNPVAAYNVYQAESVCAGGDDPITDFQNPAERVEFLAQRESLKTLCAGLSPAQLQERLQFLVTAARAGIAAAQIDFYTEGPNGKTIDLTENRTDPVVEQWKKDAMVYLKSAANQGEPMALGLLSLAYDAGELVPQDQKMSLAYSVAEAMLRKNIHTTEQWRRRYAGQLSEAEFHQAVELGTQMALDCCKR